ncbi:MAG: response regulator [Pirellulales bacterium]
MALIIEDDLDIASASSLRLQAAGLDTLIAASAEEGLAVAAARHPDVIVLDIRLPKMDGLAALRALSMQTGTKDIPVVALSACVGHKLAALEQGARYFLKKPCEASQLIDAVQATIGRPRPSVNESS